MDKVAEETKETKEPITGLESFYGRDLNLEDMLQLGVHFGHQKSRWNPKMKKYIYTSRQGVHIINLEQTKKSLMEACEFIKSKVANGGQVLFVGTKRQAKDIVREAAEHCQMPYVIERWLGGTLTNFEVIRKRIGKLTILEELKGRGELKKYTKKEQAIFGDKINKFNHKMGGIKKMRALPAVIFAVDSVHDKLAISEAKIMGIPVVSLMDTNGDPETVDYPIPANDDAVGSLKFILAYISDCVLNGGDSQNKSDNVKKQ